MGFTGTLEKHEQVVLIRYGTGEIVDARSTGDITMELGTSSVLEVSIVRGLPVESAVVNVNSWDVYRIGDPELAEVLLDRFFRED